MTADFDELLNETIPFAQRSISRYGEFWPFAAHVSIDGESGMSMADPGEAGATRDALEMLEESLRRLAADGEIRAAAVCWNVRVMDGDGRSSDAIAIGLDSASEDKLLLSLDYRKRFLRPVRYGELEVIDSSDAPTIFTT